MSARTPTITAVPPTTGGRIKWARRRLGLSLDSVAKAASTSRQHLIKLERDEHTPTDELLARVAPVLEQPLEFFTEARSETEARKELAQGFDQLYDALVVLARLAVAEASRQQRGDPQ